MSTNEQVFRFEAVVEPLEQMGGTHQIRFPYSVEELFGVRGTVRMKCRLNELEVERALIPQGDGTHYLILSRELTRRARLKPGGRVLVELQRDENPNMVKLPEELQEALALEPGAQEKFAQLTPGRQRSIAYWIDSAKRPETRAQRAVEMLNRLMSGYFHPAARKSQPEK